MNFVEHQTTLQTLLSSLGGLRYSGNYIYSRDEDDDTYKIGMSQAGLFDRLKGAKSCYPFKSEFWLKYIIISLGGFKKAKGVKTSTAHIETSLLAESKHLSTKMVASEKPEQGNRPREYRIFARKNELYQLLKKTLNTHRNQWDFLIVFNANGWHILPNKQGIEYIKINPIKSITILKPKKPTESRPEIKSMDLNQTKLRFPKDMKVGDKIPKSKNWDAFTVVEIVSKKHVGATFGNKSQVYDVWVN